MNTRVCMIQRTTVQRVTRASDSGGGYTDTWADVTSGVHCRAYSMRVMVPGVRGAIGAVEEAGPERVGVREITAVLVPKATDVTEGDRLVSITDRLGRTLYTGPMAVSSVGEYPDHKRLTVRRVA